MPIHIFYNGVGATIHFTIDASASVALMSKILEASYGLLEELVSRAVWF